MNWEFDMSSNGTIKRIVSEKGFGFVADESGQEYFFHQSACQSFDTLREGQAVTFQTGQGPKGPARRERPRILGASAARRGRAPMTPSPRIPALSPIGQSSHSAQPPSRVTS
jgi:cold shock protein